MFASVAPFEARMGVEYCTRVLCLCYGVDEYQPEVPLGRSGFVRLKFEAKKW